MQQMSPGMRVRACLLACLLALAGVLVPPVPARAVERSGCLADGNVWVVVQPDKNSAWTGCATEFSTGLEALTSAGFTLDGNPLFTKINGHPATIDGLHYWSYWHATPDARGAFSGFVYSQDNPSVSRPEPGSIQAWTNASLSASATDAMPTVTLPAARPPTTFGDQDGDGQADLMAVTTSGALLQYGVRGTHLTQPFPAGRGWQDYNWVANVPDLDGDKLTELAGRRRDGSLWLLRGHSGGSYAGAVRIGVGWNELSLLTVLDDITGDGLPELLARSTNGDLIRYSFTADSHSPGGGFLVGAAVIGRNWTGIRLATSVGDSSGDDIPDLLAVDQHGALLRYTIARGRIVAVHQVGRNWQGMGVLTSPGDLTRDGRRDLVALRTDGTLWAYPHQGNATWGALRQLDVGLTDVVGLA